MTTRYVYVLAIVSTILSGCLTQPVTSAVGSAEYVAREPIATSLFPSDQTVLGDEAVNRILSSKLELPAKAKVALMQFPNTGSGSRYYGTFYWRNEEFLKLQQSQMDALSGALLGSDRISEATPLPSLMTPKQASIPLLREAAVRMQADLLLVFRVSSDTYSEYRAFAKDKVKSYSTCELVLLDVRTGLVPFTRVLSREKLELKQSSDLDLMETTRRAEQISAAEALRTAANDLVTFIKSTPRRS